MSHSSKDFFCVILPELGAMYLENWDDTNVFYLRDASKSALIKEWADECGVFYLER